VRFALRDSKPADFDSLYELDQRCFPPGIAYSRRELAYYMKLPGAFTIIADTAGSKPALAGFIVAQRHPKGMGHIVTIDTVEAHRRHGLGTLLMNEAEKRLQSLGCPSVFLEAAVDNLAAIKFYKKLGYFIVKTLPRYYQNKVDGFLLAKRFAPPSAP
jgi:ribosomal-protein-alanine N-acetyltransferase